jgi:hypothetical protein
MFEKVEIQTPEGIPNLSKRVFSKNAYGLLKKFVQVWLPALGSLYFGLAQIYGFSNAEQVLGTMALITTFLGVTLGISSNRYNNSDAPYDGQIVVMNNEGGPKLFSLELGKNPDELEAMDSIRFKVTGENQ